MENNSNKWSWSEFNDNNRTAADQHLNTSVNKERGGFLYALEAARTKPASWKFRNGFEAKSPVIGSTYPRISPKSYENRDYSEGNEIIQWSKEVLGITLLPWQEFLLRESLVRVDGRHRYRTILTVVARQNGKTLLTAIRILGGMCLLGEKFVVGTAHNRIMALEAWQFAYSLAEQAGLPLGFMRKATGAEEFYIGGSRYKLATGNTGGARGLAGVDLVVMDELREMVRWDGYAALDKTRRIRRDSQVWAITTEGDMNSTVLNKLQQMGRDSIEAGEESPIGYFEWSAPPDLHASNREAWAYANPALGYILDEDTIESEFRTDPAKIFEVEVLCRKVTLMQQWIEPDDWDQCASRHPFPIDRPFVLAVDAVPELRHVSIVAGAWVDNIHHIESVATFTGHRALELAESRLVELLGRWKPSALVTTAKSPCEPLVSRLANSAGITHMSLRPADWARACRAFYAAVRARTVSHPGGGVISHALSVTKRGPDGLVTEVHRINDGVDNDAALAAIMALWTPTQLPYEPPLAWTAY